MSAPQQTLANPLLQSTLLEQATRACKVSDLMSFWRKNSNKAQRNGQRQGTKQDSLFTVMNHFQKIFMHFSVIG